MLYPLSYEGWKLKKCWSGAISSPPHGCGYPAHKRRIPRESIRERN